MNRLLLATALLLLAPLAMAGTPRVDARQERQDDRIDNKEDRAKADGVVTARERASLHRSENRASRNIRRQKHDRQDRD